MSSAAEAAAAGAGPLLTADPDRLWTAVQAKPRCEKRIAEWCGRLHLTHYLPLRKQVKRYQRRNVTTFIPLFRGYLFAQLSPEERLQLGQFQKVARIFPMDREREAPLLAELRAVRIFELAGLASALEIRPELAPGTPVTIAGGPLRGASGIVERRQGKARITVNIELLGQSVTVEVAAAELETE
ncbi:MAG: transcription termination/antitermination NusG family protein [Lentisphaeria bacterium]|jgi:transcription antitermination factor NusG